MTVGISEPAAFPGSDGDPQYATRIFRELVEDETFSAVEMAPLRTAEARSKIARLKQERDVVVDIDAGQPLYKGGHSLAALDSCARARAVDVVCDAVDEAVDVGAARVNIVSGADPGAQQREAATEALVDSVLEIYSYCDQRGQVELSMKMADREVDKRFLIGPTAEGVALAQQVKVARPGFGLVLNHAHLPLLGEEPRVSVNVAAGYLARAQIGNCVRRDPTSPWYGDRHPPIGLPGGEVGARELAGFLTALVDVGYIGGRTKGVVSFEVRPVPGHGPWATVAQCKRVLADAWKLVPDGR